MIHASNKKALELCHFDQTKHVYLHGSETDLSFGESSHFALEIHFYCEPNSEPVLRWTEWARSTPACMSLGWPTCTRWRRTHPRSVPSGDPSTQWADRVVVPEEEETDSGLRAMRVVLPR